MSLAYKELLPTEAFKMWEDFCEDLGFEHIRQTYGRYWPRKPVEGERVWAVYNGDERVGWCSLRLDPVDPFTWFVEGIFSQSRGHGYSKEIMLWALQTSKDIWGVDTMLYEISNHALLYTYIQYHVKRLFEQRIPGEFAVGYISEPSPGYTLFGIRRVI